MKDGKRTVVIIPANGVVTVLPGPDNNGRVSDQGVVYATSQDRTLAIFKVDLEERGIEVTEVRESTRIDGLESAGVNA